ncbi:MULTISPECIES: N-acetylglucosamine kinase [unclassified Rhizobium]|uniref:N-acetylglucosamine kinase n=1 Tax=unclassified Rhizobium TaxID=2613769 RepID=UPI001AD96223|nr:MULTISPECIES: BadF/BadG/BcrA/BcrD ATPase family protein [unclassified Rhizobium]MBO9127296.1 N-acetylglucosamine kinase [Rhizobium sp. 16-488-2b]MBO9177739.1 N-acetylglucosamine kinase [Rhizobium sp. 16-488-2a]
MLILGLDGGGSNVRLAIATEAGDVIHRSAAGGVNPMDNPTWRENFQEIIASAGAFLKDVELGVMGLPGWGEVPSLDKEVADWLEQNLPFRLYLLNDVELAQRAAFDDGPGILLLSGTGSMAMARSHDGVMLRAGGFGDLIGDEGSAYDIGRRGLARLSHELDGRQPATPFGNQLTARLKLAEQDYSQSFMDWIYRKTHARSAIASISAIINELADAADPLAIEILTTAGKELGAHYSALSSRIGRSGLEWSHAGSTFKSAIFRKAVEHSVGHPPIPPKRDALGGALRIAERLRSTF